MNYCHVLENGKCGNLFLCASFDRKARHDVSHLLSPLQWLPIYSVGVIHIPSLSERRSHFNYGIIITIFKINWPCWCLIVITYIKSGPKWMLLESSGLFFLSTWFSNIGMFDSTFNFLTFQWTIIYFHPKLNVKI